MVLQYPFFPEQASNIPLNDDLFFVTVFSAILAFLVAFRVFKFYKLAGMSALLGMPVGFAFLAASYMLVNTDLWVHDGTELDGVIDWVSLVILSYSFSLMAISYHYRSADFHDGARLVRVMSYAIIPLMGLLMTVVLSTSEQRELVPFQIADEYFAIFNMAAIGYILLKSVRGILTDGTTRPMYIPVAFALLWIGQFLAFASAVSGELTEIIMPEAASLAGLLIFTYTLYSRVLRGGKVAKRATP
ncbi:MAG: hypothetical protein HMLIMOIP_001215 [Candidatus Nitrosomirales archaeon]|jgi:hypothetical protein